MAVTYGYGRVAPIELDTDVLIDDFRELPAAIERVGESRATRRGPSAV